MSVNSRFQRANPGGSYRRLMDKSDLEDSEFISPATKSGLQELCSTSSNDDNNPSQQSNEIATANTDHKNQFYPHHNIEHHDTTLLKDVEKHAKITSRVYFSAFFVAIGGFLFGYDTGVISSAMLLIEQDFSMTALEKGIVVGATTIGAFFGSLGAGLISDTMGRRITSILAALVFILGALVMAFAHNYAFLVIGRLIVGFGVGLASMVVPIYIGEISPRYYRGRLVTLNVLMITGGQVVAYMIGIAFIEIGQGWRWMVGVSALPAMIQLIGFPFVPESPRYLVRAAKPAKAKKVLQMIYPDAPESFLDKEIATIQDTIAETTTGSYKELLHYPNSRPMIIACGLQAFQQLSGFDTAMYYGGTIMKMAGFATVKSATIFSVLVALTNFLMTAVALYVIDKIGRRRILLVTIIGMVIGLLLLGTGFIFVTGFVPKQDSCSEYGTRCGSCLQDDRCAFTIPEKICLPKPDNGDEYKIMNISLSTYSSTDYYNSCPDVNYRGTYLTLMSLVFYVAAYALGLGHAPWLIQSELFPLNVRGRANGIATATNWIFNLAVSVSFLPLTEAITATGTFWLYAGIMILGWIFVFRWVPETKGKSLEEVKEVFF
ncbi:hypothetical protein G9A89_017977 [Geosiphon pyriformis]|nr:hypothetical protein G9A89_017977 [Geosiphon pyriformis]